MIDFKTYSPTLKAHLEIAPPALLYHYTSPESLVGILSTKEMWASHASFLNDALEVRHGFSVAQELIKERLKSKNEIIYEQFFTQIEISLTAYFAEMASGSNYYTGLRKRAYVISFTELPDALSQWRGYCPLAGGYVVGIPSVQIADMAAEQEFQLVKCIYGLDLQTTILNEIIDTAVIAYKKNIDEGDSPDSLIINQDAFFEYLITVCSTMKHDSFIEEQEWRLILLRKDDEIDKQPLYFRANINKGIIPYRKFKLTSNRYPNLI